MDNKAITIKADDYRFPTRDERKAIYAAEPELRPIGFDFTSPLVAILNENVLVKDAHQRDNLHWWDNCLQNRIYNLSQAYLNALVHFQRGIPDDLNDFEEHQYINRLQFDFYVETYYYFFAVTTDNIAQMLNIFYGLGFKETSIHFNEKFATVLPANVRAEVERFFKSTRDAKEFRNSFTHRYPPNQVDNRSGVEINGDVATFFSARGKVIKSSDFKNNIVTSQRELANLLDSLRTLLIPKK